MHLDPLRSLVAPAFASLFLILFVCAFVVQRPASVGIEVPVLRVRAIPIKDCADVLSDRDVVIRIQNDGSTWINETKLNPNVLRETLAKIYEYRQEKFVYMLVDREVPYSQFARIWGQAASSTPGLHIGLLTRQFTNQMKECSLESGCTEVWPKEPFNNYCKYVPPLLPAFQGRLAVRTHRTRQ
jgi:biopolymer transport protein ExbD